MPNVSTTVSNHATSSFAPAMSTGNLDSRASAEILAFLRRSVDEFGQSIVMVTHDPAAAAYADRVLFLADGRIVDEMRSPTSELVLERMKGFELAGRRG